VPVYEGRFFIVPEAVVLDDIRSQVERGARHITFGDADFLNGPGHSMRLVRAMHAEFPALTFDFTAKIEHLLKHRTLLPECAEAGCVFVISAVESFNDTVLAHLRKGHTRRDVFEALRLVRQSGLTLRPSLVAFTPWTTLEDYVEMFELVAHHDLIDAIDPVQYTVRLLVPPGSALLDRDPLPHPIGEFVVELDEAGFQHRWRHPDPRMDALHEAVTALVEGAARTHEEPRATFSRLWELACAHAGRPAPGPVPDGGSANPAPRLSEPWFCCAEPTGEQQEAISD
jgi:hypothetical protein